MKVCSYVLANMFLYFICLYMFLYMFLLVFRLYIEFIYSTHLESVYVAMLVFAGR